ncbi:MAG: nucleotidyltransferase domain-containing protein [Actinomycetota bacterium]|nr:nucleotidyltransferase domain-containing protein [Actinomycetota bacterium]
MSPQHPTEPVRSIAQRVADELDETGARAVALVGSYARGEAGPESDLDILAIGPESLSSGLELRDGLLVSVSSRPLEGHRQALGNPASICTAVPGWREAVVLHDPEGLAGSLVREAKEWSWTPLERRCNGWVAEEITGYAEEVHKLAAVLRSDVLSTAAIQRSLLAIHLAPILAVHRRVLYGSENRLWDLVADAMGERWREAQSQALGLGGESLGQTCASALRLYGLAAEEVASLLDGRQRGVVGQARRLAQSASL